MNQIKNLTFYEWSFFFILIVAVCGFVLCVAHFGS